MNKADQVTTSMQKKGTMYLDTHPTVGRQVAIAQRCWQAFVAITLVVATLPRLIINYGPDENGANSARAALRFFQTGVYSSSRAPGNPLFEYLLTPIVPWAGYIGANLLVLCFYVAAVLMFADLVRQVPGRWLVVSVFALTPIMLVNAAVTMDYVCGLALLLAAYTLLTRHCYGLAALCLACAIGFRLPNILFVGAALLYLFLRRDRWQDMLRFALISLVGGVLFFGPILARVGLGIFNIPASPLQGGSYTLLVLYNGVMLLGPIATVAVALLLLRQHRQVGESVRAALRGRDPAIVLEGSTILLFIALFVRHADQTAYLLPVVPFLYLLLARWLSPRQWMGLAACVLIFGLVTPDFKGGESGRRTLTLQPAWGIVVADYQERQDMERLRGQVCSVNPAARAVFLTGLGQVLTFQNPALAKVTANQIDPRLDPAGVDEPTNIYRCVDREVYLVYVLSKENVQRLRADGFSVYIFNKYAPSLVINQYKYDPYAVGAQRLDIDDTHAFEQVGMP